MGKKIIIVIMLCLVILAGVLVLVFSQGSCPTSSDCLQLQDCYDRHTEENSLNHSLLFSCSDSVGWVCCPAAPTRRVMTLTNPEVNKKLLPLDHCGVIAVNRIIEGTEAAPGMFPWMALLNYNLNGTNGKTDFLCGGTLISKKYVLTAAHCTTTEHGLPISVRLGELDLSTPEDCDDLEGCAPEPVNIDVEKVISHKDYSNPYLKNDIALLRLKTDAPRTDYILPICLPFDLNITGEEENKKYTVAGWGKVEDLKTRGSEVLLFTKVPNAPVSECTLAVEQNVRPINELQLCAGGVGGNDACKGDSGGPLMETVVVIVDGRATAKTFQVGIVSFGASTCGSQVPSVYTRVTAYLNWILRSLEP